MGLITSLLAVFVQSPLLVGNCASVLRVGTHHLNPHNQCRERVCIVSSTPGSVLFSNEKPVRGFLCLPALAQFPPPQVADYLRHSIPLALEALEAYSPAGRLPSLCSIGEITNLILAFSDFTFECSALII